MTAKKVSETRLYAVGRRLAFMTAGMREDSAVDHMVFEGYWNALMLYVGPDGQAVLENITKGLDDSEIGLLILSMTRAMAAKRSGAMTHNGLELLSRWVLANAMQSCSSEEVAKTLLLKQDEHDDGLDAEVSVRENRMELATVSGNVIDLSRIFSRKH